MSNLSYIQFENTYADLRDCFEALEDKGVEGLSEREQEWALKLIRLCRKVADEFGDEDEG